MGKRPSLHSTSSIQYRPSRGRQVVRANPGRAYQPLGRSLTPAPTLSARYSLGRMRGWAGGTGDSSGSGGQDPGTEGGAGGDASSGGTGDQGSGGGSGGDQSGGGSQGPSGALIAKLPEAWSTQQLSGALNTLIAHARQIGVLVKYGSTDYWIGEQSVYSMPPDWLNLWVVKQLYPPYGSPGFNYYGLPYGSTNESGTARAKRTALWGANEDWIRQTADELLDRLTLNDGYPDSYSQFTFAWSRLVQTWRGIMADFESRKPVYQYSATVVGATPQWDQLQVSYGQTMATAVSTELAGLTITWRGNMQQGAYFWARRCADPLIVTIDGLLAGERIQWTNFDDQQTWSRTDYAIGDAERQMLQGWRTALVDYEKIRTLNFNEGIAYAQNFLAQCQAWAAQLKVELPTWEQQHTQTEQADLAKKSAALEAIITNWEQQWLQVIDPATYYAGLVTSVYPYGLDWKTGTWNDGGSARSQFLTLMNSAWAHFRTNLHSGINFDMPNAWHMTNELAGTINNVLTPAFIAAQAQITPPTMGLPVPITPDSGAVTSSSGGQFPPLPPSGFPTTRPRTNFEKTLNWGAVALIVFMAAKWGGGVVGTGKQLLSKDNTRY